MTISLLNSRNLISKLKTYFPSLEETETGVSNAYGYVINGFPKIFGANLRKERVNKGFTQKDMYMKLSVTPSTYSYWETGSHPPRVKKGVGDLKNTIHRCRRTDFRKSSNIGCFATIIINSNVVF